MKIVLCSGIQFCNIGDVGHVTGMLELLGKYIPEARVTLWPTIGVPEFATLLHRYWPRLTILPSAHIGSVDGAEPEYTPGDPAIMHALESADLIVGGHGEVAKMRWITSRFKKPYGIFGVTVGEPPTGWFRELVAGASFYFTRETASLRNLEGATAPDAVVRFGVDATFASVVRDDRFAQSFLSAKHLTAKEFICVVPRLRVTPYYRIPPAWRHHPQPWSEDRIRALDELNDRHKERDHAKARTAMIRWVRETGKRVLLAPEMLHNVDLFDELFLHDLPADVRDSVERVDTFWNEDEAAAVYREAFAVMSFECHSPIIAYGQGTPAFYLRQPEDTIKGQMYYDLGLSDWVFEIDETTGEAIADRLMETYRDPERAARHVQDAMEKARAIHGEALGVIRSVGATRR